MMKIKELPKRFESSVAEIACRLLSHYKDTQGIIVIGSVADGTYNRTSDIDIVWIKSWPLDYKKQFRIEEDLERINKCSQRFKDCPQTQWQGQISEGNRNRRDSSLYQVVREETPQIFTIAGLTIRDKLQNLVSESGKKMLISR